MKRFLMILAVAAVSVLLLTSGKQIKKEAFFQTNLHCEKCAEKIKENVSFEKGVKALEIQVDDKTVKITYDGSKTDAEKLKKAIQKLGYKADIIYDKAL